MGEVDVESMLIDGAPGRQAEDHVVTRFIDGARGFLLLTGRRASAGSAVGMREGTDVGGETVDLRLGQMA